MYLTFVSTLTHSPQGHVTVILTLLLLEMEYSDLEVNIMPADALAPIKSPERQQACYWLCRTDNMYFRSRVNFTYFGLAKSTTWFEMDIYLLSLKQFCISRVKSVILKHISGLYIFSQKLWMWHDLGDDESTLVQVMAWYPQATSHYMNQCAQR